MYLGSISILKFYVSQPPFSFPQRKPLKKRGYSFYGVDYFTNSFYVSKFELRSTKFYVYIYSSLRQIHGFLYTLPRCKYSHFIAVNSNFEFYNSSSKSYTTVMISFDKTFTKNKVFSFRGIMFRASLRFFKFYLRVLSSMSDTAVNSIFKFYVSVLFYTASAV